MERIEALAEVAEDTTRSPEERDAAIAALKNLAETAETFHERQTAANVLRNMNAGESTDDEISDELLRLLYGTDDADLARELWRKSNQ